MRAYLLVLLLISAAAGAQTTWRISGKVVDARGGQPVARCVVEINPTRQRIASLSVTTGDDGRFAFAGLALGKYQLTAAKRGYLPQSYQQHEIFSTAIAVGPGLPSEDLIFNLTPQSILYGVITDEAGDPVRRANVRIISAQPQDGVRSRQARQAVMTDDLGKYEIAELPPGNYYLVVTAEPWYAHGAGQMRMRFAGPAGEVVQGGADSPLDVAYPTTFYLNATDSEEATPIPLRGGERIEINLTLNAQHALRLELPVPAGQEGAFNVSLSQSIFGQSEPMSVGTQVNRGNGLLEIDGVLPGRYDVTLNEFGASKPTTKHFTADLGVGATALSEVDAVDEVTVSGKITSLPDKVPNARISLVATHPRQNYSTGLEESGEFSLKVPPGEYEVIGYVPQMYLARVSSPNAPVHGRMLQVKAGASPVLQIVAGQGYGQIDGFVEAGAQRPGGVMVLLAPEDAKDNPILFRRDQSDSDGSFSLYDIIPGRYRLLAIEQGWDLEWSDPNVLSAFLKKSIPLQVHENEHLNQLVAVQPK